MLPRIYSTQWISSFLASLYMLDVSAKEERWKKERQMAPGNQLVLVGGNNIILRHGSEGGLMPMNNGFVEQFQCIRRQSKPIDMCLHFVALQLE